MFTLQHVEVAAAVYTELTGGKTAAIFSPITKHARVQTFTATRTRGSLALAYTFTRTTHRGLALGL